MEIIGHTASLNKNKGALNHFLISNPCEKVEMDFALTKDNVLVWTHNVVADGKFIHNHQYRELKGLITLEDVLEVLDGVDLLLEIKSMGYKVALQELMKALEILKLYSGNTSIQSFNANLIRELLANKDTLSWLDIGLIINIFKGINYRKGKITGLEKTDFLSLSSEFWRTDRVKDNYQYYRELFPDAKIYAWTWDKLHESNEIILGYIEKEADGIITNNTELVRALVKRKEATHKDDD